MNKAKSISELRANSNKRAEYHTELFLSKMNQIKLIPHEERMDVIKILLKESFKSFGEESCDIQLNHCSEYILKIGFKLISEEILSKVDNVVYEKLPF
jgi:hypothetical protein